MEKINLKFEWADGYQEARINRIYNRIAGNLLKGLITEREADYTFIINLQNEDCLNVWQAGDVFMNTNFKKVVNEARNYDD